MGESTLDSIIILVAIFSMVLLFFCLLFTFLWQKEMRQADERAVSYRVGVLPFRAPPDTTLSPSEESEMTSV